MSRCCPSQISTHVRASMDVARTFVLSGASAMLMNSKALAKSTSPARIAVGSFHWVWTVGTPLLTSSPSMMSSWMRVKLWVSSSASAAGITSVELPFFTASAASSSTAGRSRFPPASRRCALALPRSSHAVPKYRSMSASTWLAVCSRYSLRSMSYSLPLSPSGHLDPLPVGEDMYVVVQGIPEGFGEFRVA
ncbi:MAG: hypothetical protein A4E38_00668 [Methanoregulaceae archaeon PtaB.Bin108]|nr:MAG: hypothetical protein A4E38_00668 [Methanoregulaceae archaeon PtaB.Bin108]